MFVFIFYHLFVSISDVDDENFNDAISLSASNQCIVNDNDTANNNVDDDNNNESRRESNNNNNNNDDEGNENDDENDESNTGTTHDNAKANANNNDDDDGDIDIAGYFSSTPLTRHNNSKRMHTDTDFLVVCTVCQRRHCRARKRKTTTSRRATPTPLRNRTQHAIVAGKRNH